MPENPACNKLAILYDKNAKLSPSNAPAIENFVKSARRHNLHAEVISLCDIYRIHEFDFLFIRMTTERLGAVRDFARTAENFGLFVMDSTVAIDLGSDKVIQTRYFQHHGIPMPITYVIDKGYAPVYWLPLGYPRVIKNPYTCFSSGVFLAHKQHGYVEFVNTMLEKLESVIVQEFIQTEFDWRVVVLGRRILLVCKYFMTEGHWKVIKHDRHGGFVDGKSECVPIDDVPLAVLKAAQVIMPIIGQGLYGIDIKQTADGQVYVLEVNDNPNIDAGVEDELYGDKVYDWIIEHFVQPGGFDGHYHCLDWA